MLRSFLALGCLAISAPFSLAGEFNKVLAIGDKAPSWEGLDGTDGKKHSLADLKGKDVVVVIFTCNSCPSAAAYESRIIPFAAKHAGPDAKVAVVAINVNLLKEDSLPEMTKRAEKKKYPYPYLFDPSQEIAKKFGAKYTPEFFVLDKARKVVYMGAMDDKDPPAEAGANFLEAAVLAALAGKTPEKKETLGRGCMIRFSTKKSDD